MAQGIDSWLTLVYHHGKKDYTNKKQGIVKNMFLFKNLLENCQHISN